MTTTTNSNLATEKQIAFIVSMVNKINGTRFSHLSQVRNHINLSSSGCTRLTKTEASAIIDTLKAKVA